MSARPCSRCGGVIVFGKDKDTGRVIPLMVGSRVYRVVKDNIVALDPKAFIPHICSTMASVEASPPQDFDDTTAAR